MSEYINSILGINGAFNKESPNYQPRQQQIDMANSVELALNSRKHAVIEAGTGTGKTFAYLVPAINYSIKNNVNVVVSTKTKNLQSQILNKDIPFLKKILPFNFNTEKVVGIGNYICFHRLLKYLNSDNIDNIKTLRKIVSFYCNDDSKFYKINELAKQKRSLLDEEENIDNNLKRIEAILSIDEELEENNDSDIESGEGTREEFYEEIENKLWSVICAESDSCHRKSCEFFENCFYFKAKERQKTANLLVVNHALFFADLAVRKSVGFSIDNAVIPNHNVVIFDEAHDIENVASNFMGIQVSNYRIKHFVGTLVSNINNNKTLRKIVGNTKISEMSNIVEEITAETVSFFNDIREKYTKKENSSFTTRVKEPYFVKHYGLLGVLEKVKTTIMDIINSITIETDANSEIKDLKVFVERTTLLIGNLNKLMSMSGKDWAYWLDISDKKVAICGSPVDVAKELRGSLFGRIDSCVLTSATIAVNNSFDFIGKRLGLDDISDCVSLMVGSPFNYFNQAMLCVPENSIEPTTFNNDQFSERVGEQIKDIIKISKGRAFVLFTSYKLMNDVYDLIIDELNDWEYPVYRQSSNCSRDRLIQKFLENDNSILFGAESFWQGVDVPGEKLSCVIIPKIPFANPSEPLIEARMDYIKQKGLNPFITYSLPDSILKLKQGTGRLIRRESDRGILAILDRRILTKGYGYNIINSLPKYYQTKNIEDLKLVFNKEE
ncbi:MAG: DEAD/DEAH box helicase [Methanothrix sp.]|jgi:ATP-dependent DNA helicase DinG|nr:DEAD/DEAH box helicase [Methanothrix sp.]